MLLMETGASRLMALCPQRLLMNLGAIRTSVSNSAAVEGSNPSLETEICIATKDVSRTCIRIGRCFVRNVSEDRNGAGFDKHRYR